MSGDTDLDRLLASMAAELHPERFVFVRLDQGTATPAGLSVVASVVESEGLTIVVPADQAKNHELTSEFPCAQITLQVHSALDAVGFLAVVSTALAETGISVNAMAGFHHDHLFVPWARRHEAMAVLGDLANSRDRRREDAPHG